MRREIFSEEHELFRSQVRRFVEAEIAPKVAEWNRNRMSDRETWRKVGAAGYLGATTTNYGLARPGDLYTLSRVRINGTDSISAFAQKIQALHA